MQLNSVFMSMAGLACQQLYIIRKDTDRTHILEHGFATVSLKEQATRDLLLLLNAYAMWDASLGYCQVTDAPPTHPPTHTHTHTHILLVQILHASVDCADAHASLNLTTFMGPSGNRLVGDCIVIRTE